jgi:hypothetical protein
MDFLSNNIEDSSQWTSVELTKGVRKRRVDQVPEWSPKDHNVQLGETHSQQVHAAGDVFKLESYKTEASSMLPVSFSNTTAIKASLDLLHSFEKALVQHADSEKESLLVVFKNAYNNQLRRAVGLPGSPISSNQTAYLSLTESFTHLHKKNMNLQSTNVLWYGSPIIWLVVPPRHACKLEAQIARVLQVSPACSQFVGHTAIVFPPSLLSQWGVNFTMVEQFPGEVIQIDYGAYCAKWSVGSNLWEEFNSSDDPSWQPPPLYRHCGDKCDSGILTVCDDTSWKWEDFSLITTEQLIEEETHSGHSHTTLSSDSMVDVVQLQENLDINLSEINQKLSDAELDCLRALQSQIEDTQEHIDPSLLELNGTLLVENFTTGTHSPYSSRGADIPSAGSEQMNDLGFEVISREDVQDSSSSQEVEQIFDAVMPDENAHTPVISNHVSGLSPRHSETAQPASREDPDQSEMLPYRSGGSNNPLSATDESPENSKRQTMPATGDSNGDVANTLSKYDEGLLKKQNYLNDLASAIGSDEVLRDLVEMVDALHQTPKSASSKLGAAMTTFLLGEANSRLGALQKDISALFIATRARQLLQHFQDLKENRRRQNKTQRKRKRQLRDVSFDTVINLSTEPPANLTAVSKNRYMTDVYNRLVEELMQPDVDADKLRQRVQAAYYHGKRLLPYQDICGSDHPLWVLLPTRALKSPRNHKLDIEPSMFVIELFLLGDFANL